jgi:ubiquinone/menaquinone biosynthesis C-methylase UbiE
VRIDPGESTAISADQYGLKKRMDLIRKHVRIKGAILDIGCGCGAYTYEMSKHSRMIVGIDIQEKDLEFAKALTKGIKKIELSSMSAENLGFNDNTFDMIFLIEVLEHIPDQNRAFKEINRVLKPGGLLVILVPNKFYLFETHGAHIGGYDIDHIIPFLSWMPEWLRRHFTRARIYTMRNLKELFIENDYKITGEDYMYPPLDNLASKKLANRLRSYFARLEKTSLRCFGISIMIVGEKQSGRA